MSQAPGARSSGNGSPIAPLPPSRGLRTQRRLAKRRLDVFWIYWDTAWSLIISGVMFTTIVTHPDAEFAEIRAGRQ